MANIADGLENIARGGANTLNFIAQLRMQQQANAIREKRFMLQQQFESQQKQKEIDAANEREMNSQRFRAKENELDRELQREKNRQDQKNADRAYKAGGANKNLASYLNSITGLESALFGIEKQSLLAQRNSLLTSAANYGTPVDPIALRLIDLKLQNVQSRSAAFIKNAAGNILGLDIPDIQQYEQPKENPNYRIPTAERLYQEEVTGNRSNTINPEWTATGDTSKMSLKQGKTEMVTMISPDGKEVKIAKSKVKKAQDQGYKLKETVGKYQIRVVE